MSPKLKNGIRRTLLLLHILLTLALLLSAFLPRLHPRSYWLSGMAGLPFLFLIVLSLLFIPVWLVYRKKYYLLSIAVVLLCLQPLGVSFGAHLFDHSDAGPARPDKRFTVMTFNTSSLGLKNYEEDPYIQESIYRMLQEAQPDILCMQEFYSCDDTPRTNHYQAMTTRLQYQQRFFTNDREGWNILHYGIVLYSHFPVLQARRIPVDSGQSGSGRSILEADLLVHNDTVRVYTAQLKSYMFNATDYAAISRIKHLNDFSLRNTRHIIGKMHRTFAQRAAEADTLHALIARSPYPVVLCGDFNDVPVSYTYNTLSDGMHDTFLNQGWGVGRTYNGVSPTLRIDYILTQPAFHCDGFASFPHRGFEHVPIMATLSLDKH